MMYFTITTLTAYTALVIGVLMGLLLISKPADNRAANRILGLFFIAVVFSINEETFNVVLNSGRSGRILTVIDNTDTLILIFGPLLLTYIRQTVMDIKITIFRAFLHFLPFMLIFVIRMVVPLTGFFETAFGIGKIVHVLCYSVYLSYRIRRLGNILKEISSDSRKIDIRWLQYLVLGLLGIFIIMAVLGSLLLIFNHSVILQASDTMVMFIVSIWIISIWYKAGRQGRLFIQYENDNPDTKYAFSKLSSEMKNRYLKEIEDLIKMDKLYLKSELTLKHLSDSSGIPVAAISQVINEETGMMFFDFINSYRIRECISSFQRGEAINKTILAVAFESGFNSKSAFYSAFRKETGTSPGKYIAEMD